MRSLFIVFMLTTVFFQPVNADTIYTRDGAKLIGKITKITPAQVVIDTAFAGVINVKQSFIETLSTDEDLTSRLADGTTVTGKVKINSSGVMEVKNKTLNMQTPLDKLLATWIPEQAPPAEAGYKKNREWKYSLSADINGTQGNSSEMGMAVQAVAKLVGDTDTLQFNASINRAQKSGTETANDTLFGFSYVTYVYQPWGWYVQGDVENDKFEGIDLRTDLTGGMSYRMINQPDHKLSFNTGFGYRYETYINGTNRGVPTLDFGVKHEWKLEPWLDMTNSITFAPALSNFGDYLLRHDSGFNIPIASGNWNLRLGVKNDYKSKPLTGKKKLDTTYYTRIQMNF